ncbi:hypothetical protein [uncultured Umboniibacter sp.]|uniref:hypothetical protein n=1 Tax=uncultured Umboniibacter sp. TaxID=1798917 RepID=UPI002634FF04|nr:hypothetical protein [uncultured Umboniibacter sp.]
MSETIISKMKDLSDSIGLPCHYRDDLRLDFNSIQMHGHSAQYIWLLRTAGTNLFKLGIGLDPEPIKYYVERSGLECHAFLIDVSAGSVTPISNVTAANLASKAPVLSLTMTPLNTLLNVLDYGVKHQLWGLFERPNIDVCPTKLNEWQRYFLIQGNEPMLALFQQVLNHKEVRHA